MKLQFGCELSYQVAAPTLFISTLEVAKISSHRDLRENLRIQPSTERRTHTRPETGTRYFSFVAPEGPLTLRYEASADLRLVHTDPAAIVQVPVAEVPLEHFHYLLPSRFSPSDKLANFAAREFGALPPGHARVTEICNWIYDHIAYVRGTSDAETSAVDTLIARSGVCRDFAHLGVAFCRALGIPARFISCYAYGLEPADFHAVFEAYLGGYWWLFDATRQASLDGVVRIGMGRDAADVSFSTVYGQVEQTGMRIWIEPAAGEQAPEQRTTEAVRTE
jgi:transglutaminase-like putative cysteine protease